MDEDVQTWFVTPDNNLRALRELLITEDVNFIMPSAGIHRGFTQLDGATVSDEDAHWVSLLDGMTRTASPIDLAELETEFDKFDILVTGASFVTTDGLRMGKGHGYFDLEWAILREVGLVDENTLVVAVGHDVQVVETDFDRDEIASAHDTIVDYIVTPTEIRHIEDSGAKPEGIHWDLLTEEDIEKTPPLQELLSRKRD